ncbi:SAM-dependent methyltransferase [Synechocystis salina]|uniref:SAM-dependent methyltransferase n=1 Tax=Synechocystis salina TaxID=945780 RepID=UPI001D1408B3|nr:SAM-dependent methyltransferase [Synechocystis salina]
MKAVIDEVVAKPYFQQKHCTRWKQNVVQKDESFQRKSILRQGKANFITGESDLTPDQTALLYCRHYLQMHLMSSRYLFDVYADSQFGREFPLNPDQITMIDFGCGPMTSGLALAWHYQERHNTKLAMNYFGIDHAPAMLKLAKNFSQNNQLFSQNSNFHFLTECDNSKVLIKYIKSVENQHQKYPVFLNFSYLFASDSLDQCQLVNIINNTLEYFNKRSFIILFQNPPLPYLNQKWFDFKKQLAYKFDAIQGEIKLPYYEYQFLEQNRSEIMKPRINLYYEIISI